MSDVIRTVWTYTVDGRQMGTYTEGYARGMFETLRDQGARDVELVALDHVASDFAATGRNWTVARRIVASTLDAATLAHEAAVKATAAAEHDGEFPGRTPYFQDAAALLLEAFQAARSEGRLGRVSRALARLTSNEPYRAHKLLISLKRGRQADVLNALAAY